MTNEDLNKPISHVLHSQKEAKLCGQYEKGILVEDLSH
jgi:hypothetical protein